MPCSITLLPVALEKRAFHDFDACEKLLDAVMAIDWRTYVIALRGGESGLRVGEIVRWSGPTSTSSGGRSTPFVCWNREWRSPTVEKYWRRVKAAIGS